MSPISPKPQAPSQYFVKIQSIVADITGVDPEDITYGMEFDELSMTPVELAEFFSRMNKEFAIRLKPSDLQENATLGELALYLEDELS